MEKMQSCKFQQLSTTEMSCVSGGAWWGWKLTGCHNVLLNGEEITWTQWEYINIWGNSVERQDRQD
jgi:bacteriocin-like protein